jgi:hypothetical protein
MPTCAAGVRVAAKTGHRRHHDHRDVGEIGIPLEVAVHTHARLLRHGDVEADEVGRVRPSLRQPLAAIGGRQGGHNPPDGSNWENLCGYCRNAEHSRTLLGWYFSEEK